LLGPLLRRLRAGRAVEDVARSIGVARSAIYHWEGDKRQPDPTNLGALLDHYEADDDDRAQAWRLRSLPRDATEDDIDTVCDDTLTEDTPCGGAA
jgi:transcriptional regulator with XRE-family HTH domain